MRGKPPETVGNTEADVGEEEADLIARKIYSVDVAFPVNESELLLGNGPRKMSHSEPQ